MANINSLTTSNSYSSASSIYGNRNVLTGLASGMDTETMIQNSVAGYQTKIQELQQSQEKLEWKQDAYRDLIDQMYSITDKYTSYLSSTNLASNTFFTSNVTTTANGENAKALTATGKATSDIQINAVTQLATAARYAVSADALNIKATNDTAGDAINWAASVTKGTLSGTLSLKLGSNTVDIKFTEDDQYNSLEEFVAGINEKLADISVNSAKKGVVKADSIITATLNGSGSITFNTSSPDGDSAYISGASGNLKTMLNVSTATSTADPNRFTYKSFSVAGSVSGLTETKNMVEYLSGKSLEVTLDGATKTIKIDDLLASDKEYTFETYNENKEWVTVTKKLADMSVTDLDALESKDSTLSKLLQSSLQSAVNKAFGSGRITVNLTDLKSQGLGEKNFIGRGLSFDVAKDSGSTLKVTSSAGDELGISDAGVSNYFNTSQKLGKLLGEDWLNENARVMVDAADVTARTVDGVSKLFDADNKEVRRDGDNYYRVNSDGDWIYSMEINGTRVGEFTKDTALERVLSSINSSSDVGVKVSYSNLTSEFVFTSNETGAGSDIQFGEGLAQRLFGVKDNRETKLTDLLGETANQFNWDANGKTKVFFSGSGARSKMVELDKNMSVQDLIDAIETASPRHKGMVQYDAETGTFSLTYAGEELDSETAASFILGQGSDQEGNVVKFGLDVLLKSTPGATKTAGTDAVVHATVNGKELTLTRSSNVIAMDGLSVTLKDKFNVDDDGKAVKGEAVTFTTSSNADTIVDAIKSFVDDVNKLMTSVHDAYTTQPIAKTSSSSSKGTTYYEPLTEDDKNSMSEDAVKKYEEKAKTGILFGDSDLRTLYDKLLNAIQSYGSDRIDMESIGLTTTYSGGVTTISLNETKLREALDSDPDKVRTVFTKTRDGGSATDGLMSTLKNTLNAYGSTSSGSPGILVRKAGTKLSSVSLLNNNIAKQISNLDSQIESWQTKLSNRIDYYTKQFTALEKLMSTMNNQSSMLADLMGY